MMRLTISTLLLGTALIFAGAAEAKSIKRDVPPEALASYCQEHGVGSETTASITLDDGTTLTGTVHCEAEDLLVADDNIPGADDATDDHEGHGNEAGDDHRGSDHDGGDDHSGHGGSDGGGNGGSHDDSGSHDSGSDDHGGHGGHGGDD